MAHNINTLILNKDTYEPIINEEKIKILNESSKKAELNQLNLIELQETHKCIFINLSFETLDKDFFERESEQEKVNFKQKKSNSIFFLLNMFHSHGIKLKIEKNLKLTATDSEQKKALEKLKKYQVAIKKEIDNEIKFEKEINDISNIIKKYTNMRVILFYSTESNEKESNFERSSTYVTLNNLLKMVENDTNNSYIFIYIYRPKQRSHSHDVYTFFNNDTKVKTKIEKIEKKKNKNKKIFLIREYNLGSNDKNLNFLNDVSFLKEDFIDILAIPHTPDINHIITEHIKHNQNFFNTFKKYLKPNSDVEYNLITAAIIIDEKNKFSSGKITYGGGIKYGGGPDEEFKLVPIPTSIFKSFKPYTLYEITQIKAFYNTYLRPLSIPVNFLSIYPKSKSDGEEFDDFNDRLYPDLSVKNKKYYLKNGKINDIPIFYKHQKQESLEFDTFKINYKRATYIDSVYFFKVEKDESTVLQSEEDIIFDENKKIIKDGYKYDDEALIAVLKRYISHLELKLKTKDFYDLIILQSRLLTIYEFVKKKIKQNNDKEYKKLEYKYNKLTILFNYDYNLRKNNHKIPFDKEKCLSVEEEIDIFIEFYNKLNLLNDFKPGIKNKIINFFEPFKIFLEDYKKQVIGVVKKQLKKSDEVIEFLQELKKN